MQDDPETAVAEDKGALVWLITILYNSQASLPAFLRSLQAQTLQDWRLIAIDNGSGDRSAALVTAAADSRICLLRTDRNLGFARAANQGLRAAARRGAQFFVLLNIHTVFEPDFLAEFVAARQRLDAAVIAPRIMSLDDPGRAWYAGGHLEDGWVFVNINDAYDAADTRLSRSVEFAPGCCLGLTRRVLQTVGLFDERFFVYWEDTDLCLRLKAARIPIMYVREPYLLHEGGASSGGEFSSVYIRLYYRSYIQFLRKHFGMRRALVTAYRLIGREMGRPVRNFSMISGTAAAMAAGFLTPSRPIDRLKP